MPDKVLIGLIVGVCAIGLAVAIPLVVASRQHPDEPGKPQVVRVSQIQSPPTTATVPPQPMAERTEDIKSEISDLRRQIEQTNKDTRGRVTALVDRINQLKVEVDSLRAELAELKGREASRKPMIANDAKEAMYQGRLVSEWIDQSKDMDNDTRSKAFSALRVLSKTSPEALEAIKLGLNDSVPLVLMVAGKTLWDAKPEYRGEIVATVRRLSVSSRIGDRLSALYMINEIAEPLPEFVAVVRNLQGEKDESVSGPAGSVMRKLNDKLNGSK